MTRTAHTALARREPSAPARALMTSGLIQTGHSVLDWGCGQGTDVDYYLDVGLDAFCYDPHWQPRQPHKRYDRVVAAYVVNVLPTPEERVKSLRQAARFLKPRGVMAVIARSRSSVEAARSDQWTRYRDGYRTSTNSFQRGFMQDELCALVAAAGLHPCPWPLGVSAAVGCLGVKGSGESCPSR